ncbi:hypothetical protein LVY72_24010 [Arthrobacter sp. I2-34]|uniref:Uncharacterized protein n=1 Tax=Arthrobacter hankyongi TaxID=2904801 RepID=A0ABS9LEA0_9MICC|nr:hypothetical protein [Arthrobacter hankyongi]MCG2624958.1 hypothetical protein [Arthrobacter hankyongi]
MMRKASIAQRAPLRRRIITLSSSASTRMTGRTAPMLLQETTDAIVSRVSASTEGVRSVTSSSSCFTCASWEKYSTRQAAAPMTKLAIQASREAFTTVGGAVNGWIGGGVASDISGRGSRCASLVPVRSVGGTPAAGPPSEWLPAGS